MNDFRRSEQPKLERAFKEARDGSVLKDIAYSQKLTGEKAKPTTSDMTPKDLLLSAYYRGRDKASYSDFDLASDLEAIEAHYAAKQEMANTEGQLEAYMTWQNLIESRLKAAKAFSQPTDELVSDLKTVKLIIERLNNTEEV